MTTMWETARKKMTEEGRIYSVEHIHNTFAPFLTMDEVKENLEEDVKTGLAICRQVFVPGKPIYFTYNEKVVKHEVDSRPWWLKDSEPQC